MVGRYPEKKSICSFKRRIWLKVDEDHFVRFNDLMTEKASSGSFDLLPNRFENEKNSSYLF